MTLKSVHDLLLDELRDIYHAERQLLKALPKMAKASNSGQLRQAFEHHLEETNGHVERLDRVFETLGKGARGQRCEAMQGLIEEAQELIDEIETPEVLDVGLITAAQKVEHYEISAYGSARALAESLGQDEIVKLLDETLGEEKKADEKLNQIALSEVNRAALKVAA
jgi:ferritin-like metal-binding protein YciE